MGGYSAIIFSRFFIKQTWAKRNKFNKKLLSNIFLVVFVWHKVALLNSYHYDYDIFLIFSLDLFFDFFVLKMM